MPDQKVEIVVLAGRYKVHHFRSLEAHFAGRFAYEESYDPRILLAYRPEMVITFDEHYCELANLIGVARQQGIATLQVMDGILEWRRTWDYTRHGRPIDGRALPLNQPAISHKIACLGRRDARILESWGNGGKCEIVGAPRLDSLLHLRRQGNVRPHPREGRKPRLLVMTAKTPGFTPEQVQTTLGSLRDLKQYFSQRPDLDVVWRLTQDLHRDLGVSNTLADLTGGELRDVLLNVDAVITTPSTSMLEAMLLNRPTALLDYHNTPHYFEAAWTISAERHIAPIVADLLDPPPARLDYQDFLLDDQLACAGTSTATERLSRLIEAMLDSRRQRWEDGRYLPRRIIADGDLETTAELPLGDLGRYYPHMPGTGEADVRRLAIELAAARGSVVTLHDEIRVLRDRLEKIPGYRALRWARRRLRI
jgi:hypothetical protein